MRILVVDDDPISRELLSEPLAGLGYQVFTASDGQEAWARTAHGNIDLIITDWMMPEMDGLELCRRVRQDTSRPYTYVILVSSRTEAHEVVQALQAGADEFIRKPISPFELAARVESMNRLRRLQADLEHRNRELEEAQKFKTEWIHMIVHDLRSPLAVMNGALEFMQVFPDRDNSKRLDAGVREARRVQAMLEQMLVTAKSDAGALRPAWETVDLSAFLSECIDANRDAAEPHGLRIVVECPEGVSLRMDPSLMRRALDNLVSNAIKYGADGDSIFVACKLDGEHASLCVGDEGPGVDAEDVAGLFKSYSTFKSKRNVSQVGLGLSFCHLVARAHNGQIRYEPREPKGSTFRISWPGVREPTAVSPTGGRS